MALANRKLNRKTRKVNRKRRGLAFASRKSRRNNRRNMRKSSKSRKSRKSRRQQRGGDYLEALSRPFFASVYPNSMQTTYSTWTGAQPNNYPADPRPEVSTWHYYANGNPINPGLITKINTDFNMMTGPSFNPTQLVADGAGVNAGSAVVPGAGASSGSGAGSGAGVTQSSIAENMALGRQSTQSFTS